MEAPFFRVNPCNIDFVEKKAMYDKRAMMSLVDDDKLCDVEDDSDFEIGAINREVHVPEVDVEDHTDSDNENDVDAPTEVIDNSSHNFSSEDKDNNGDGIGASLEMDQGIDEIDNSRLEDKIDGAGVDELNSVHD